MQGRHTLFLRVTRALLLLAVLLVAPPWARSAEGAPVWPTAGWQRSSPEEQGMASSALAELVDFGAANAMDSVLVTRHGKMVLEAHYAPFKPGMKHTVNSVTKGVVGTLAAIAHKEGTIDRLDAPVLPFFAERRGLAHLDADKKAITLQSLLDMTSGLSWREPLTAEAPESMLQMERSGDWVGFVLDRPMAQAPGTAFNYDSGTWQLVSALLAKRAGVDPLAYARDKLFAPLAITDVTWRRDPQGLPIGGYGLFMQPQDMAKIGYLYLRRGAWEGRQLMAPKWVERTFSAPVEMGFGTFRYANGWWTLPDRRAHIAVGFLRQLVIVLPDVDVVAVVTGRGNYPFTQLIDRIVAAAKSPSLLPPDASAGARLAERIADAGVEKRSPVVAAPSLASTVSGKTYRIEPNGTGIASFKLDLLSATPRYESTYTLPGGAIRRIDGPLGLDGLFRVRAPEGRDERLYAVKGTWLSDTSFQTITRSLTEGIVMTHVLTFNGTHVDISFEDNRGARFRMRGEAE